MYSQMGALRKHDLGRLATFLAGLSQFLSQRPGHGQFLISRPEMNRENTGRSPISKQIYKITCAEAVGRCMLIRAVPAAICWSHPDSRLARSAAAFAAAPG